ncbi:hypothetical protein GEMRC1_010317 [Eukaryota sp. GEM-RC1]
MSGGLLTLMPRSTSTCSHFTKLNLSGNATVLIDEPDCIPTVVLLIMRDKSLLTSTGLLHTNTFSFMGGTIGDSSAIHVIDLLSATTDQPKTFASNVSLVVNSTGEFVLSSSYNNQITTFGTGAVVFVPLHASLSMSSTNTSFLFTADCTDNTSFTGFINFGVLTVSTLAQSTFDVDVISTNHLSFENNSITNINGLLVIDGLTFIKDQSFVTVTGSIHQSASDVLCLSPGIEGGLFLDSEDSTFSGEIVCEYDHVCITVVSGNTTFTKSQISSYFKFAVNGGSVYNHGSTHELVCQLFGGHVFVEHDSVLFNMSATIFNGSLYLSSSTTIESINFHQSGGVSLIKGAADSMSLTLTGGQTSFVDKFVLHQLDFLSISDTSLLFIEPLTNISSSLSKWYISGGELFVSSSVALSLDRVYFNQSGGGVTFNASSVQNSLHFSDLILCNGTFALNEVYSVDVDRFVLCGGLRKGTGNINVYSLFSWTSGILTEAGTTTLFAPSFISETTPKILNDSHSLLNWHNMELRQTGLDINQSNLINHANATILLSNSTLHSDRSVQDQVSVLNYGSIISQELSSSLLSSPTLNNGSLVVTQNSVLTTTSSIYNFGHISIDTSSVLTIQNQFEFSSSTSFSGFGTIQISSITATLDIGIDFTNISKLIVDDYATVTSSLYCRLSYFNLIVSNATFVSSHCHMTFLNVSLENFALFNFTGTSSLSFFNMDILSGKFIGFGYNAYISALGSSISLSGKDSLMELTEGLQLSNELELLSLVNQSVVILHDDVNFDHFTIITLIVDDAFFHFREPFVTLFVSNLRSLSGNVINSGSISVTKSATVESIKLSGNGSTLFSSTAQCNFISGNVIVDSHNLVFDCNGFILDSNFSVLNSELFMDVSSDLTVSNSKFVGDGTVISSGSVSFENFNLFNIQTKIAGTFVISELSGVLVNSSMLFENTSRSIISGSVQISKSSSIDMYGHLECDHHSTCLINSGSLTIHTSSNISQIYLSSLYGTITVNSDTVINRLSLSSSGGESSIFSAVTYLDLFEISGGNIIISSSISNLNVSEAYGGIVEVVDSIVSHFTQFVISGDILFSATLATFNLDDSILNIDNGRLLINSDCDLIFSNPSSSVLNQSNGVVSSFVPLVLSSLIISNGTFSSNVVVQEQFSVQIGKILDSNITATKIDTCSDSLIILNSNIFLDDVFSTLCWSQWDLTNSTFIINTSDQFLCPHNFTLLDLNNDSSVVFTRLFYFEYSHSALFNTTVYFNRGVVIRGSLAAQFPMISSGDVIVKETGKLSFDNLSIPKDSTLLSLMVLGSLYVSGTYTHDRILTFTPSTTVIVSLHLDSSYDKVIVDDVYYDGELVIIFDPLLPLIESTEYTFFTHESYQGIFATKSGSCTFNFGFKYNCTRMFARVGREFDPNYSEVFHIAPSPFGFDSHCCGSDIAPCRTLETTLSKVVHGDTIIFISGVYSGYTPLIFDNRNIEIFGENCQFICDSDDFGISFFNSTATISSLSFSSCDSAINSWSSHLFINDLSVSSPVDSLPGRVLNSVNSSVTFATTVFQHLAGTLFSLFNSDINFENLVIFNSTGTIFESESTSITANLLQISDCSSSFDFSSSIVSIPDISIINTSLLSISNSDHVSDPSTITVSSIDGLHSSLIISNTYLSLDVLSFVDSSLSLLTSQFVDSSVLSFKNSTVDASSSIISSSLLSSIDSSVEITTCLFNVSFVGIHDSVFSLDHVNKSSLFFMKMSLIDSVLYVSNHDIIVDSLIVKLSDFIISTYVVFQVKSGLLIDSDLSILGGGTIILQSKVNFASGNLSISEQSSLVLGSRSILELNNPNCFIIADSYSQILNYGQVLVTFPNSTVHIAPYLLNFGTIFLCNSSLIFTDFGFNNHGELISCSGLSHLNFQNGNVFIHELSSSFHGFFTVSGADVQLNISAMTSDVFITSGKVTAVSPIIFDCFVSIDVSCPFIDFDDVSLSTINNDLYWFEYCDYGLSVTQTSTFSNVHVINGIITFDSDVFLSTLTLNASNSLLFLPSFRSTVLMPGPFINKGNVVGNGTLILDNARFKDNSKICYNGDVDCLPSCSDLFTCNDCVSYNDCGWSLDFNKCDSANQDRSPRFLKYLDWYVDDCHLCTFTNNGFNFSSIRTDFDSFNYELTIPYIRNGNFWIIDFQFVDDLHQLSSCSNREMPQFRDVISSNDHDVLAITAPNAKQLLALNNPHHLAYFNNNIWQVSPTSCDAVKYTIQLSLTSLMTCNNGIQSNSTTSSLFLKKVPRTNLFFHTGSVVLNLFSLPTHIISFENQFYYSFVSRITLSNFHHLVCETQNNCDSEIFKVSVVFLEDGFRLKLPKPLWKVDFSGPLVSPTSFDHQVDERHIDFLSSVNNPMLFVGLYTVQDSTFHDSLSFNITIDDIPSPINHQSQESILITKASDSMSFTNLEQITQNDLILSHNFGPFVHRQDISVSIFGSFDDVILALSFCDVSLTRCEPLEYESLSVSETGVIQLITQVPSVEMADSYVILVKLPSSVLTAPVYVHPILNWLLIISLVLMAVILVITTILAIVLRKKLKRNFPL